MSYLNQKHTYFQLFLNSYDKEILNQRQFDTFKGLPNEKFRLSNRVFPQLVR